MKKQKKVMILIWNMGLGGIQKRVRDIAIDISQNYPQCKLYLLVKFKQSSFFADDLEPLKNIEIRYYSTSHRDSKSFPSFLWVLLNYLTIRPDICLTFLEHLSITMILIKHLVFWHKVKLVLNEGVYTFTYLKINRRPFWQRLVQFFYKYADQMIVPTQAIKTGLVNIFQVPAEKIFVIPNWTLFQPQKEVVRKKYDLAYIGRFDEEKNPLGFIRLTKEIKKVHPTVKSIMIGDGKQNKEVQNLRKKYHLSEQIELPGSVRPQEYLHNTKVLVMTTLNEGMPNVVLEAGILEVPTVSTHFAGAEEVILNNKTGYITESFPDMVKKTIILIKNNKKRKALGAAMKRRVKKYYSLSSQKEFIATLLRLKK